MPRRKLAHGLQMPQLLQKRPSGAGPSSFSILRSASRASRTSSGFAPMMFCASTDAAACPRAQAFGSMAKSLILPSLTFNSTVTVDPQMRLTFVAAPSGADRCPTWGISAASSRTRP
jgi:hypothetical protein